MGPADRIRADPRSATARSPSRIASSLRPRYASERPRRRGAVRRSGVARAAPPTPSAPSPRTGARPRASPAKAAWAWQSAQVPGSSSKALGFIPRSSSVCSRVENPDQIVVRGQVGDERGRVDALAARPSDGASALQVALGEIGHGHASWKVRLDGHQARTRSNSSLASGLAAGAGECRRARSSRPGVES